MRSIRGLGLLPHGARLQHDVLPAHSKHHHHHPRRHHRGTPDRRPGSSGGVHAHRDMRERLVPMRRRRRRRARMLSERLRVRHGELHALCRHRHRHGAEGVTWERGGRLGWDERARQRSAGCVYGPGPGVDRVFMGRCLMSWLASSWFSHLLFSFVIEL